MTITRISWIFLLLWSAGAWANDAPGLDAMIAKAKAEASFPLTANDSVRQALRQYLDPKNRAATDKAICRYESYRKKLSPFLKKSKLPQDLMAVPFVETGYKSGAGTNHAGIWNFSYFGSQYYGLVIDKGIDERKDMNKENALAAKYFSTQYQTFKSWPLVILANFKGAGSVLAQTEDAGITDPWVIQNKITPDDLYLSRVFAAIILLHNLKCH